MSIRVQSASGASGNYFQVSAQPGQVVPAGTLELGNLTDQPITVLLDPVRGLTASTLGSAYGLRGSSASEPASWVVVDQHRVALAPHGRARVPVSVRMGAGVQSGDYLAGIGVQAGGAGKVQVHGNVAISSIQRYAIGVEMTAPGPRNPHIQLFGANLDRKPAGVTFSILGRNDGNVILQNVRGQAMISSGGDVVAHRAIGPGTFVTGTSIAYPILVPSLQPTVGTAYRVRASLRYPGGTAQINKIVRFGQIDAERQQAYGGPAANSGGGGNHLLPILLIAAVAACLAALEVRRRRRSGSGSSVVALQRALPREIAHARDSGEPLSVTLVPANGRNPRELAAGIRGCLRPRDKVFRLSRSGLMVVSPDTTPEAGQLLAAEIRRHLSRGAGNGDAAVSVTNAAEFSAEDLLQAATAGADRGTGRGQADNGGGQSDNGGGQAGTDEKAQSRANGSGTEAPGPGYDGSHRR
ncbi:MAG: hypothetical protein M3O76_00845 [Actinomycetota bacterium]|nr:hypothetical protein [Actinomycetota bacterium]